MKKNDTKFLRKTCNLEALSPNFLDKDVFFSFFGALEIVITQYFVSSKVLIVTACAVEIRGMKLRSTLGVLAFTLAQELEAEILRSQLMKGQQHDHVVFGVYYFYAYLRCSRNLGKPILKTTHFYFSILLCANNVDKNIL